MALSACDYCKAVLQSIAFNRYTSVIQHTCMIYSGLFQSRLLPFKILFVLDQKNNYQDVWPILPKQLKGCTYLKLYTWHLAHKTNTMQRDMLENLFYQECNDLIVAYDLQELCIIHTVMHGITFRMIVISIDSSTISHSRVSVIPWTASFYSSISSLGTLTRIFN